MSDCLVQGSIACKLHQLRGASIEFALISHQHAIRLKLAKLSSYQDSVIMLFAVPTEQQAADKSATGGGHAARLTDQPGAGSQAEPNDILLQASSG